MNLKYLAGFTHLLATNVRHKNKEETYALYAVVLSEKFAKCALLDTWVDMSAEWSARSVHVL
jgi:hypothetical protein